MSDQTSDDFEFIKRRLESLENDDDPALDPDDEPCPVCEGVGWEFFGTRHGVEIYRECSCCFNPERLESP